MNHTIDPAARTARWTRATVAATAAVALAVAAGCSSGSAGPTASTHTSGTPSTSTTSPVPTGSPTPTATPTVTPTPTATPTPTTPTPGQGGTLSSRIAYPWGWPGPMSADTSVRHTPKVPPVPELVQISAAEHAGTLTSGAYDRIAFTFTRAFPSSDFWYSNTLLTVGEGTVIPRRPNTIWLGISFMVAQAHTSSGHSSILSQPPATIGEHRLVGFVQAGDFEGGLNYGLAIAYPLAANGQVPVRVVEVATVSSTGQHLFTVAFDFPVK